MVYLIDVQGRTAVLVAAAVCAGSAPPTCWVCVCSSRKIPILAAGWTAAPVEHAGARMPALLLLRWRYPRLPLRHRVAMALVRLARGAEFGVEPWAAGSFWSMSRPGPASQWRLCRCSAMAACMRPDARVRIDRFQPAGELPRRLKQQFEQPRLLAT